jgi:hypothetical protein
MMLVLVGVFVLPRSVLERRGFGQELLAPGIKVGIKNLGDINSRGWIISWNICKRDRLKKNKRRSGVVAIGGAASVCGFW